MELYYYIIVGTVVLVSLYLYHSIYLYGRELSDISKYYENGKGTLYGKYIFTERFMELFFSTFALNYILFEVIGMSVENIFIPWFQAMMITLAILSILELFKASKNIVLFIIFSLIIVIALVIFPINNGVLITSKVVLIAVVMDFFANIFGKQLSKLPEDLQFIRLKFPNFISKNKSFTAVIISTLIVFSIFPYFIGLDSEIILLIAIGAVVGDAIFSIYKRLSDIDDYIQTLGSIGGILDRIDGWIGGMLFAYLGLMLSSFLLNFIEQQGLIQLIFLLIMGIFVVIASYQIMFEIRYDSYCSFKKGIKSRFKDNSLLILLYGLYIFYSYILVDKKLICIELFAESEIITLYTIFMIIYIISIMLLNNHIFSKVINTYNKIYGARH